MTVMKKYLFLIALLMFFGCDQNSAVPDVKLPSDLQVDVTVTAAGFVSVIASARNANFYRVYFSDDATPIESKDGKASYQYDESGEKTITVQAHTTANDFITKHETVTVDLEDDNNPDIPNEGYTTPESYPNMTLVWQDEFAGDALNTTYWTHEIGTGSNGWGNNEKQYYRSENVSVQDGYLVITAKSESYLGSSFTSSRIITKGKKSFKYGRVDIRAKLPQGQGIWPALWMLGSNIDTTPWPASGEIDIMEMIGGSGREKTVYGTLHWDNNGAHACTCDKPGYTLSSGTFADKFHVFSMIWDSGKITWYVDDVKFNEIDITPSALSEFHNPYFFIFNVAVGGNWPGEPNAGTVFPQKMVVDYVRVFQN
jgi:beta-glucanase (GH16 family)